MALDGTPSHPRLLARGTRRAASEVGEIRALIYAPTPHRARFVETELDREGCIVQIGHSVNAVVTVLVDDPAPYPSLLVVDFDDVDPIQLMQLHTIRERGWFGSIIGLGTVAAALRQSLAIDHVLTPPFVQDSLRDALAHLTAQTRQIPVMRIVAAADR